MKSKLIAAALGLGLFLAGPGRASAQYYGGYGNGGHDLAPHGHTTQTPYGNYSYYGNGQHDLSSHEHSVSPYGGVQSYSYTPFSSTQSYNGYPSYGSGYSSSYYRGYGNRSYGNRSYGNGYGIGYGNRTYGNRASFGLRSRFGRW